MSSLPAQTKLSSYSTTVSAGLLGCGYSVPPSPPALWAAAKDNTRHRHAPSATLGCSAFGAMKVCTNNLVKTSSTSACMPFVTVFACGQCCSLAHLAQAMAAHTNRKVEVDVIECVECVEGLFTMRRECSKHSTQHLVETSSKPWELEQLEVE